MKPTKQKWYTCLEKTNSTHLYGLSEKKKEFRSKTNYRISVHELNTAADWQPFATNDNPLV